MDRIVLFGWDRLGKENEVQVVVGGILELSIHRSRSAKIGDVAYQYSLLLLRTSSNSRRNDELLQSKSTWRVESEVDSGHGVRSAIHELSMRQHTYTEEEYSIEFLIVGGNSRYF